MCTQLQCSVMWLELIMRLLCLQSRIFMTFSARNEKNIFLTIASVSTWIRLISLLIYRTWACVSRANYALIFHPIFRSAVSRKKTWLQEKKIQRTNQIMKENGKSNQHWIAVARLSQLKPIFELVSFSKLPNSLCRFEKFCHSRSLKITSHFWEPTLNKFIVCTWIDKFEDVLTSLCLN